MADRTLFIIKPDAVSRGLVGRIISRFEERGFKMLRMRMFTFTREQAEDFYGVHRDRPFFGELVSFITSGPVVAAEIEGRDAVAAVRLMVGATKSNEAAPGSIRGDYGLGLSENVIHASDSAKSHEHESGVAFGRP
ncbi:MAG: nucleoside-diphosphate kinase [Nitrosopumilus sp.]|nr:nucleoside-diphosphate kinase [Nitrosopumilus sp.]